MLRFVLSAGTLVLACSLFSASAPAQSYKLYRWVDERGVVTYSDRRPADPNVADSVQQVSRSISLYTPDKTLLQAVEAARVQSSRPETRAEAHAPGRLAPSAAPTPLLNDPCAQMDCTAFSGSGYPFPGTLPVGRRAPHLVQAVLPPGAIAGTVNSPGMIPGQTGSNSVLPGPFNYLPPVDPHRPRGPLMPARNLLTGDR